MADHSATPRAAPLALPRWHAARPRVDSRSRVQHQRRNELRVGQLAADYDSRRARGREQWEEFMTCPIAPIIIQPTVESC